jgi:hypothetical protein
MTTVSSEEFEEALRQVHARITTKLQPGEFTRETYAAANSEQGVTQKSAIQTINAGIRAGLITFVGKRAIAGHTTSIYKLTQGV